MRSKKIKGKTRKIIKGIDTGILVTGEAFKDIYLRSRTPLDILPNLEVTAKELMKKKGLKGSTVFKYPAKLSKKLGGRSFLKQKGIGGRITRQYIADEFHKGRFRKR